VIKVPKCVKIKRGNYLEVTLGIQVKGFLETLSMRELSENKQRLVPLTA
jgi:hypothetical protein